MHTVFYWGGMICGSAAVVCWWVWTFEKDETVLRVAKSGSTAAMLLFAISYFLGRGQ